MKQKTAKQKTAIRQMIELIENSIIHHDVISHDITASVLRYIKNKAEDLEPVNEQHIKDAWKNGRPFWGNIDDDEAQEYFNDTFEKL